MMTTKQWSLFKENLGTQNPVFVQVLGICSTLAVTNVLKNTLVMCLGLIFVTALSNLTLSLLRAWIPPRIRMMVEVLVIACLVMLVDIYLKAYAPAISRQLGPYVGLIITNCIIMGRAEGFASQNRPLPSLVDGFASGIGYSMILITIALVREPMGFGTILGVPLPAREQWWHQWTIMVMPPGAFFTLALVTWFARNRLEKTMKAGGK